MDVPLRMPFTQEDISLLSSYGFIEKLDDEYFCRMLDYGEVTVIRYEDLYSVFVPDNMAHKVPTKAHPTLEALFSYMEPVLSATLIWRYKALSDALELVLHDHPGTAVRYATHDLLGPLCRSRLSG